MTKGRLKREFDGEQFSSFIDFYWTWFLQPNSLLHYYLCAEKNASIPGACLIISVFQLL